MRKWSAVNTISNMEWPQLELNTLVCVHAPCLEKEYVLTCYKYIHIVLATFITPSSNVSHFSSIKISLDMPLIEERLMRKQKRVNQK